MRRPLVTVGSVIAFTLFGCASQRSREPSPRTSEPPALSTTRPATSPSAAGSPYVSDADHDAMGAKIFREQQSLPPLHRAAFFGDAATVARLLDAGADVNARAAIPDYVLPNPTRRDETISPLAAAMAGAADDASRRTFPVGDERNGEWTITDRRRRERATRGQADPDRGPMRFVQVERLLLARGASARDADPTNGLTPLHLAAASGNVELVRPLLAAGADPNASRRWRGEVPMVPLAFAAGWGDVDLVQALLDAGADPSRVPEESRGSLLVRTVQDSAVLQLLLDHGMVLPPRALARAATAHAPAESLALIRKYANADAPADRDAALVAAIRSAGHDPLSAEASSQMLATVRSLLDAGASASAPNGTGEALVDAITNERDDVAALLRQRGAKVDWSRLKDDEHRPFKIAYDAAFTKRLDVLRSCEAAGMPLDVLGASVLGKAERLRQQIATKPADVAGEGGAMPLYFAIAFGHADCVRILLDAGADPNARMPSWDTPDIGPRPLDGAATGGHADVVRLLLDRGADPKLLTLDADDLAKLTPAIAAMLGMH